MSTPKLIGALTQTVAPTVEPVTIEQVKVNKRVDFTDEDTLIGDLISQARHQVEAITHLQLINATYTYKLDCFPHLIYLPRPPLSSVTSIAYIDTAGDSQTLATSVYTVDSSSRPARISEAWGQTWPDLRGVLNPVTVTFVAGYGAAASNVPWPLRRAVLILACHYWEYRDGEAPIPEGLLQLLDPYIEPAYA